MSSRHSGRLIDSGHMSGPVPGSGSRLVVAVSFAALLLVAFGWPDARRGYTDFLSFYSGARLVGTTYLYSAEHSQQIQEPYAKGKEVRAYIRPPVYAVLLWPLARLPYRTAHSAWQVLNLAALAIFLRLWAPSAAAALVCCWYFPLWINFILAQDNPLFLVCLAASAALLKRGRQFAGGLLFALCGIKFHLLMLLPLVVVRKRLWRFARGVAAGGAAMLTISFAVAGWSWPVQYYGLLRLNETLQASQGQMANLKGLFFGLPYSTLWWLIGASVVAVSVWYIVHRVELKRSLAFAAAGGLLISPHAYLSDCTLLLPLLLGLSGSIGLAGVLPAALFVGAASLTLARPEAASAGQLAILVLFAWAVYVAIHEEQRLVAVGPEYGHRAIEDG